MKSKTTITALVICLILLCYILQDKINTPAFDLKKTAHTLPLRLKYPNLKSKAFAAELLHSKSNRSNQNKQLSEHIENRIIVHANDQKGQVNKKIFGNMFISNYLPPEKTNGREYFGRSNYGDGIWDPKLKKSVKEVIDLARNAGISIVRISAGEPQTWKNAIGSKRNNFQYGLDELLKTTAEIGAEVIYRVQYSTGNIENAADLVEYLNSPDDGSNPNGGIDWAKERSKNGHPKPYNIKYFEIGNEVYNKVSSTSYALGYLKFYNKMKEVDSSIKIGVVLSYYDYWNRSTMKIIKDKIDFGIAHAFSRPYGGYKVLREEDSTRMSAKEIFEKSLCLPQLRFNWIFQKALKTMAAEAHKPIPLAITEYNSAFVQQKPVPYRHTLGNALVISEFLHIFLMPENNKYNILMANYNGYLGYSGMIKPNTDFMRPNFKTPVWYIKRPNYYVYQLYKNHFGDILLNHELKSESYNISHYKNFLETVITFNQIGEGTDQNLLQNEWEISRVTGVDVKTVNDILEINFKSPATFNYGQKIKSVNLSPDSYYRLSAKINTDDLIDNKGIHLYAQGNKFSSHTYGIKGNAGWVYCDTIFKTLPDTKNIRLIVRRHGEDGPLKGKVFLKDIKLEKFIPSINTNIPYLSVTTSKSSDSKTIYLMVTNKSLEQDLKTEIILNNFKPDGIARIYSLWGDRISSTNEKRPYNKVRIHENEVTLSKNVLKTSFKKHSVTAIEITGDCE